MERQICYHERTSEHILLSERREEKGGTDLKGIAGAFECRQPFGRRRGPRWLGHGTRTADQTRPLERERKREEINMQSDNQKLPKKNLAHRHLQSPYCRDMVPSI